MVRLISDLHFSHKSMAQKHRKFQDEYYHDEFIIEQWNKTVTSKKDLTYILGDITMETAFPYYKLDRLNGRKIVALGNHDKIQDVPELLKYVEKVGGAIDYKGFLLTHVPIHESELQFCRGNIHGHTHERLIDNPKYFNVSAEAIDYRPKTIDELLIKYRSNDSR